MSSFASAVAAEQGKRLACCLGIAAAVAAVFSAIGTYFMTH